MRLLATKKTYLSLRPTLVQGEPIRLAVGVHVLVPLALERAGVFDQQELAKTFLDGAAFVDEGFAKGAGEYLVAGEAYARDGVASPAVKPRACVGRLEKSVVAIGDRRWSSAGVASEPEPFSVMPLDWSRAFGGPRCKQNLLGKGAQPGEDGVHLLPNVELPDALVASPADRPTPAGFGPVDMMWTPRHEKLGTYDEAWIQEGFPGFAKDLDRSYFNVAPPDQRLPRGTYWRGDEPITLEHLHPTRPEIAATLPGLRARVFVHQRVSGAPYAFAEVETRLETLLLLPATERVILTFRGELVVREDDGDDVLRMLIALEGIEAPRPVEHYRAAFLRRLDRKKLQRRVDESDLRPAWTEREVPERVDYEDLVKQDDLVYANMKRGLEHSFEVARARLTEQGLDADALLPMPSVPPEEPAAPDGEDAEAEVDEEVEVGHPAAAANEIKALKAVIERHIQDALASAKATCAEHGVDLDAVMEKGKEGGGGPPKFKADAIRERLRDVATLCANAGVSDDQNIGLRALADGAFEARMRTIEKLLLDGYRSFAHAFPSADLLNHAASSDLRRRIGRPVAASGGVDDARAAQPSFAGWDFTGANLSEVDFSGADLRGALLERVDLRRANLRGANLEGAVLTRADLTGAETTGARFAGANLGEARLGAVNLANADLRGCVLVKTDLGGADLSGANLSGAQLVDAELSQATLTDARGVAARLTGVRLDGARLAGSDFSSATFQRVDLANLDFSGANLERAEFVDCDGVRASFAGARMHNARFAKIEKKGWYEGANFTGADLSRACLRGLELAGADFTDANLETADLSGINAEGAKFVRATAKGSLWIRASLKGADASNANLMGATMKNADVRSATFRHANLFGANLYRVRVDGKTEIKDAELACAMYVEDRA